MLSWTPGSNPSPAGHCGKLQVPVYLSCRALWETPGTCPSLLQGTVGNSRCLSIYLSYRALWEPQAQVSLAVCSAGLFFPYWEPSSQF